jgi:hypothetical protein
LEEDEELTEEGGVEVVDDEPEFVTEEVAVMTELESEPEAVIEVSTTSKSIRSIVSCEFPLGLTEVSFSFLIIISWIPGGALKRIEYNTICSM